MRTGGRFLEGERNRQQLIDYLIANPNSTALEVANALGLDSTAVSGRLGYMAQIGEVSRNRDKIVMVANAVGVMVDRPVYAYRALVESTISADEVAAQMVANIYKTTAKPPAPKKPVTPPWVFRNDDPNRMQIKNQEAIGSGRNKVYANSSCNMI